MARPWSADGGEIVLVLLLRHQFIEVRRIGRLELEEPTLALRVLVDGRRRALERVVHGDHLAADRRAEAAGRDLADRRAVRRPDLGALAGRDAALGLEADPRTGGTVAQFRKDARGARKAAGLAAALLDRPGEPRLDRRGRRVDVVAVQAQPGLEAERVARAEPDRFDVRMGQQAFHDGAQAGGFDGDFEAVLAGIAGAADVA